MPSDTSWSESEDLLSDIGVDGEAQRDACIVLAGAALNKHGGDTIAAAESLAHVLQVIGVTPYEPEIPRTMWGYLGKAARTGVPE